MQLRILPTDKMSSRLRPAAIDTVNRRILITRFQGSKQEKDLTEPANCGGLGRIRHFRKRTNSSWPSNPLPIDPAHRALGLPQTESIRAQVFQNAVCNWRCWYCFVDFELLAASKKHSQWATAEELVDLFLNEPARPFMIDLTGGQPDLTPEWIPWMMKELRARDLDKSVYLWSDDNLSNDYFWRFLSDADIDLISSYRTYGRVCCFKGFNAESFNFNTLADPSLYAIQFELMQRLMILGIDIYAYVTFTTPSLANISSDMANFVDRLQAVDLNLPLRTVPLEIKIFTPVETRMDARKFAAIQNQHIAVAAWQDELTKRFSCAERTRSIVDVPIGRRRGGDGT